MKQQLVQLSRIDRLSLTEMAAAIANESLSIQDLTTHYLTRIAKYNAGLNAVIAKQMDDDILQQAQRAKSSTQHKQPLFGIPLTIKDVCHVQGFKMSRGVKELYGTVSKKDATVVQRLKAAGAHILGITNVPEMCMAFETDNLLYGRTNNPYDHRLSAGGSSGGEAAAIAAGMSPAGLASDACGSVRLPAHFNGIVGLKLTQGRVPLTGQYPFDRSGIFNFISSFSVMGRYVDDVALLGKIISGTDGVDPDTVPVAWMDYRDVDISQLKLAFWLDSSLSHQPSIVNSLNKARSLLANVVQDVDDATPPLMEAAFDTVWKLFVLGGTNGRSWQDLFANMNKTEFSAPLAALVEHAKHYQATPDEMRALLIMRDQVRTQMAAFFKLYDVLVCPVYPDVAFAHGKSLKHIHHYLYLFPFSLTGQPAVVVPMGLCPITGLPVGIQIVGRCWQEHYILAIANSLQQLMPKWQPALQVEKTEAFR